MLRFIKKSVKKAINRVAAPPFSSKSIKKARITRADIEKNQSLKLSRKQEKMADDYAVDVLGSKVYAPWLYVYTLMQGQFKEGWIPSNFFDDRITPAINKSVGKATRLKTFTNLILRSNSIPDIAYHIDGVLYDREMSIIPLKHLRELLDSPSQAVYVKADDSGQGRDVFRVSANELNNDFLEKIGNSVIQEAITQHEFFERIIDKTVATVRITTVKEKNGEISVRAAYLRLGRSNTSWVQSDHSVRAAIVDNRGELGEFCYSSDWRKWTAHPDTKVAFARQRIPKFKEAVNTCAELHKKVPHLTIIGWDVVINDSETIKIIEWNARHPDIRFAESAQGPCFIGLNWEQYRKIG